MTDGGSRCRRPGHWHAGTLARTLARRLATSVRYLHRIFQSHGISVAAWIWRRRLDRCRRDLLDPAMRERPVNAIAARWGQRNAAHFGRIFTATYGMPPVEYRASVAP
jgi:transcriptional regulator GlxA family with amidase domain